MKPDDLARMIDHTILKAQATQGEVLKLVHEAVTHRFASVCVNPRWAKFVRTQLKLAGVDGSNPTGGRTVLTCACVGFPLGANTSAIKGAEAAACVRDGAQEVDMVISLAAVLEGNLDGAREDVAQVVRGAKGVDPRAVVKVILETAVLNEQQIALGCQAAREGGADFVKTSTGFHPQGGATEQTVRWLKQYSGGLKVKAAGGIRDLATALVMIRAGADRLGCSSSLAILAAAEE